MENKIYNYVPEPEQFTLNENDFREICENIKNNAWDTDNPTSEEIEQEITNFLEENYWGYDTPAPSLVVSAIVPDLTKYYFRTFRKTYFIRALVTVEVKANSAEEAKELFTNISTEELGEWANDAEWEYPELAEIDDDEDNEN